MFVQKEITINKPVDEVWEFFDNPDNMTLWISGLESFEHLSGEAGQPGAKSKHVYNENGRKIEMIETVTERIPQEKFAGTFEVEGSTSEMNNEFEDLGDKTKLTSSMDVTFDSFWFKLLTPIMKMMFNKRLGTDLQNLKREVEKDKSL